MATIAQQQEAAFKRVASAADEAMRKALFAAMQQARKPGEALNIEAGISGGLRALWTLTSASIEDPTPQRVFEALTQALAQLAAMNGARS